MTNEAGTPTSVGEMIDEGKSRGMKAITVGVAAIFLVAALVYTGIHNYNLFGRFMPAEQRVFGLIPVILIEGSIIAFIVGSFVWFGFGAQKALASAFGWALFAVAGANTLIDSMYSAGDAAPEWLAVYARFFVPITPVIVAAMWKLIFDLDPAKRERDFKMATAGAILMAKHEARVRALRSGMNVKALADYGAQFDEALAVAIRESAPVVEGKSRPVAPVMQMADEGAPEATVTRDDTTKK